LSTLQAAHTKNLNILSKCVLALYAISLHEMKCKTPYTIVKEFVIPSVVEILSIMFTFKKKN
jgi:hypothetical protein